VNRHIRNGLIAALLSLLLVAPAAAATTRTIQLNWTERREYSKPHMTFRVSWVRIAGDRWTISGSFTNLGSAPLKIAPEQWASGKFSPNYGFSIVKPGDQYHSVNASSSAPRLPRQIASHGTWRGTFSGTGASRLPHGVKLSISFGYFVDQTGYGFSWLSDHAFRL
jgi:hypothetical protein